MSPFHPKRSVKAITTIWQRDDSGAWQSYLIREQQNHPPQMSKLTQVPVNVPICLACLSSNVTVYDSERFEDGELVCHECGVRYGFLL